MASQGAGSRHTNTARPATSTRSGVMKAPCEPTPARPHAREPGRSRESYRFDSESYVMDTESYVCERRVPNPLQDEIRRLTVETVRLAVRMVRLTVETVRLTPGPGRAGTRCEPAFRAHVERLAARAAPPAPGRGTRRPSSRPSRCSPPATRPPRSAGQVS